MELWTWLRLAPQLRSLLHSEDVILEIAASAVGRCKSAPLNIQLEYPQDIEDDDRHPILPNLLKSILPVSRSLMGVTLTRVPIRQISTLPKGLFPSLERLVLSFCCDGPDFEDWKVNKVDAFADAPSLRRVAIQTVRCTEGWSTGRIYESSFVVDLPWHQLTHFIKIDDGAPQSATSILEQHLPKARNLQYLNLEMTQVDCDLGPTFRECTSKLRLEALETLGLNFWVTVSMFTLYPNLFELVELPNLKRLRFEAWGFNLDGPPWTNGDLRERFIAQLHSFEKLEYLSFDLRDVTPSTFKHIFQATPQVSTLDINLRHDSKNCYSDLFKIITFPSDARHALLPRLKSSSSRSVRGTSLRPLPRSSAGSWTPDDNALPKAASAKSFSLAYTIASSETRSVSSRRFSHTALKDWSSSDMILERSERRGPKGIGLKGIQGCEIGGRLARSASNCPTTRWTSATTIIAC